MALLSNPVPKEQDRYKFTRIVSDPVVGFRHSLFRPPKFRENFNYVKHIVRPQDIGRLDLLSLTYYSVPYLWWAIALVNNIGNPFTEMHTPEGEKVKATGFIINIAGYQAILLSSRLVGAAGNSLSVEVGTGTVQGYLIIVKLGVENKKIYDNVVLSPTTSNHYIGNLISNDFVDFEVMTDGVDLLEGDYDLSGGETWDVMQTLLIPTQDEVNYALSNTISNDE